MTPSPTPDTEALYAEAQRVILAAAELEDAYLLDADNKQYPPGLTEFFTGAYLEASQQEYALIKGLGERTLPEAKVRTILHPAPEELDLDAEVAMWVCLDLTDAPLVDESGEVTSSGGMAVLVYLFKHFDGKLKVFHATAHPDLTECPFE